MDINYFKNKLEEDIIGLMLDFIKEWKYCDYTERNVNDCRRLIEDYLDSLAELKAPSEEDIMALVKDLVLSLNELNESTLGALIETDTREDICELILESAVACGLQNAGEDITEEWRMW